MELRGARVVVTGGGGFLGRHVMAVLKDRGALPVASRRAEVDLRDPAATLAWMRRQAPDLVIHAAATGGGIGFMRAHPAIACTDNLLVNTSVIEAARLVGVERYVGVSSACAYPADPPQPMREDDIEKGAPEPTNGPYGYAKRLMLVQGAAYAREYGLDCAFVVPTNLFGPHDDFDPANSHVVSALIRRFEEARRDGLPFVECWGTGRATRDLLYVDDAARAIVRLAEVGGGPEPINLGSGNERSIAEIAEAVRGAVGYPGGVRWDSTRPDGMPRKVLDTGRASARLGWSAATTLEAGLAETVRWYRRSSSS
jgi:GDP-L-fucose synthase